MKKYLWLLIIPLGILLSGCNPSHDELEMIKIAKTIPLPQLGYDSNNGDKLVYGDIFTKLVRYNEYDGKPMYALKVYYYGSHWQNHFEEANNFYFLDTPNGYFFTLEGWQVQSSNATWRVN